ncbi:ABC transporter ATP-binding protein [Cohnella endophytica]|uniref:ABC transporter ATP-binding protein n=1 Tax=Cohnella endophytica TaxID=2419778 RepID=A0A494XE29_9BACL|nr:ABC transporter ATP-binding protein [Cohnella endophytica]RKP46726.1 ABC transporter ATP-binding protein [Cohnella endophytica]
MSVIQARQLTKRYGNGKGVQSLDLEVREGEIFGFIGPNGAGKSTTIRMLLQLIAPTSGELFVLGTRIAGDHPKLRRRIGYLPSEIRLYPDMTGKQALEFAAAAHGVDLARSPALKYAERLQWDMKAKIKSYSLGNRKKLGILLSILHEPELLVLDEPTSGLDPLMQQEFYALLRELNETRGTTVFFSTHVLTEVEKLCDRVAIIREGKLVNVATVEEITAKGGHRIEAKFQAEGDLREAYGLLRLDPEAQFSQGHHVFHIGESLQETLKLLADKPLADLNIRRPTLEERFMDEYRKTEDREGGER